VKQARLNYLTTVSCQGLLLIQSVYEHACNTEICQVYGLNLFDDARKNLAPQISLSAGPRSPPVAQADAKLLVLERFDFMHTSRAFYHAPFTQWA
jgi:hypothetical protein